MQQHLPAVTPSSLAHGLLVPLLLDPELPDKRRLIECLLASQNYASLQAMLHALAHLPAEVSRFLTEALAEACSS